jgi:hypothetical protein
MSDALKAGDRLAAMAHMAVLFHLTVSSFSATNIPSLEPESRVTLLAYSLALRIFWPRESLSSDLTLPNNYSARSGFSLQRNQIAAQEVNDGDT